MENSIGLKGLIHGGVIAWFIFAGMPLPKLVFLNQFWSIYVCMLPKTVQVRF